MNNIHEANRLAWDAVSPHWQARVDTTKDWRRCPLDPRVALCEEELNYLGDLTGKQVCVLGSGDNLVVFALAGRILKPGGLFLVHEYHPVRRLWTDAPGHLELAFRYFDRGPFVYDRADEVPGTSAGSLPGYEFHWTVSDFVTALLEAGCDLLALKELGDQHQEWEQAPLAGLPEGVLLVGRRSL